MKNRPSEPERQSSTQDRQELIDTQAMYCSLKRAEKKATGEEKAVPRQYIQTIKARISELHGSEARRLIERYPVIAVNLLKKVSSDVGKTIAEAMVEGTVQEEDLEELNKDSAFRQKNEQGQPYSAKELMENFVSVIGPFLSDQALYHTAHLLAKIELKQAWDNPYRTSKLARFMMRFEIGRESWDVTKESSRLPNSFLSHIYETIWQNWQRKSDDNVRELVTLIVRPKLAHDSQKESLLNKHAYEVFGGAYDATTQIKKFGKRLEKAPFNPKTLNNQAPSNQNLVAFLEQCKVIADPYQKKLQQSTDATQKELAKAEAAHQTNKTGGFWNKMRSHSGAASNKQPKPISPKIPKRRSL